MPLTSGYNNRLKKQVKAPLPPYIANMLATPMAPANAQRAMFLGFRLPAALGVGQAVGFAVFSAPPVIATSKRRYRVPVMVSTSEVVVDVLPADNATVAVQVASVVPPSAQLSAALMLTATPIVFV